MGIAATTGIQLLINGEGVRPLTIHALEAKNNELPAWDEAQKAEGNKPELFIAKRRIALFDMRMHRVLW